MRAGESVAGKYSCGMPIRIGGELSLDGGDDVEEERLRKSQWDTRAWAASQAAFLDEGDAEVGSLGSYLDRMSFFVI